MLSGTRYLLFALTLVLLSGCGTVKNMFGGGEDNTIPPTPLVEIETLAEIIKLWSKDTGKGSTKQYLKLTPSHTQGKVFVADVRGNLIAIDATSGNTLWENDADMNITGGPGSSDTLTLIGSEDGDVLAYASENGEFLWQAKVSSEILAAPQEAYGIVVTRTIDGKIFWA